MGELYHTGCVIGELEIILGGPDLWHDLTEEDDHEGDQDNFYHEFEAPDPLFKKDHLIDEEVGKDDDGYINDTVGNKEGGQEVLGLFQQGNDAFPGGVLFCLQDI